MKKATIILILVLYISSSFAQDLYSVEFNEKEANRVSIYVVNPGLMLTQRSIDRRNRLNIPFDAIDVPIDADLIKQCEETGATVVRKSKWLNSIFVEATQQQKDDILALSFVKNVVPLFYSSNKKGKTKVSKVLSTNSDTDYGSSDLFVKQINTDYLHNKSFYGDGIQIAVLDAGFTGVNTVETFSETRNRNGIIGSYNFVDNKEDVYNSDDHGTMVLSTMCVDKPGTYVGTSPKADFWLFITEDVKSETPYEEFNWVAAIEFADSVGVDVLNTSLGYNQFDSPYISYTKGDLDGKTSLVSRAAKIGSDRGIILAVSAGNEGNNSWGTITCPADAFNIITVGACNSSGAEVGFSSFGPSADGRIKPDVVAMGQGIWVYDEDGAIRSVNGTSFSSPITAGSLACLRQAFPDASVSNIITALQETASIANNTNDKFGYGIANFKDAYVKLGGTLSDSHSSFSNVKIIPNPVKNKIRISGVNNLRYSYKIVDVQGRIVKNGITNSTEKIDVSFLVPGLYSIVILDEKGLISLSFVKQ